MVYYEDFLTATKAEELYKQLKTKVPWEHREVQLYGKKFPQPRLTYWYGDVSYTYSHLTWAPKPWPDFLQSVKENIENIAGHKFNSTLLNYYRNGQDSISFHADDEPALGENPVIASLSLGGVRNFTLKHKTDKQIEKVTLPLYSGSLLIMQGATQHHWLHGIPKTKKEVIPRINLTFRWTTE